MLKWSFLNVPYLECDQNGMCSFWNVLFLECAFFGFWSFWKVPFLECSLFAMCPFWNVLFLECEPNVMCPFGMFQNDSFQEGKDKAAILLHLSFRLNLFVLSSVGSEQSRW